jgi:recombinational DNA repair protein (RecF pathway)
MDIIRYLYPSHDQKIIFKTIEKLIQLTYLSAMGMFRECTKCGEEKGREQFYAKSGNVCKECRRAIMREYRLNKRTEEEEQKLEKKPFDEVLADITDTKRSLDHATAHLIDRLEAVHISQKDIEIKLRDLELKLEEIKWG